MTLTHSIQRWKIRCYISVAEATTDIFEKLPTMHSRSVAITDKSGLSLLASFPLTEAIVTF